MEQKPAPRHNVELNFEFKRSYGRQTVLASVKNISLTGAFVSTDQPLRPSEKISVFLNVSGRSRKVAAKVVWVSEKGAGVQFQPFNNRDIQIVDDIIYYATEKTQSTRSLLDSILKRVA
ncbi:MAG: PilZ domain-containing protein [Oligoflexia bacterium]|nr:PilZ domain-containing protein [Oligoflexia bacterium]